MRCPYCGNDVPPIHGLYCPFCGMNLYNEDLRSAESFVIATEVSGSTVAGSIDVYENLESLCVDPKYLTKAKQMMDDSLEAHIYRTNVLAEEVRKLRKKEIELEKERVIRESRARIIQNKILAINALFDKLTGLELLRENVSGFFTELSIKCKNYQDLKNKIENLCCIFECDLHGLRSLITNYKPDWKTRKIIKEWLKRQGVSDCEKTVDVWDRICCLRNMPPTHPKISKKHVDVIMSFGTGLDDWPQLWDNILVQFLHSLNEFYGILEQMLRKQK